MCLPLFLITACKRRGMLCMKGLEILSRYFNDPNFYHIHKLFGKWWLLFCDYIFKNFLIFSILLKLGLFSGNCKTTFYFFKKSDTILDL